MPYFCRYTVNSLKTRYCAVLLAISNCMLDIDTLVK